MSGLGGGAAHSEDETDIESSVDGGSGSKGHEGFEALTSSASLPVALPHVMAAPSASLPRPQSCPSFPAAVIHAIIQQQQRQQQQQQNLTKQHVLFSTGMLKRQQHVSPFARYSSQGTSLGTMNLYQQGQHVSPFARYSSQTANSCCPSAGGGSSCGATFPDYYDNIDSSAGSALQLTAFISSGTIMSAASSLTFPAEGASAVGRSDNARDTTSDIGAALTLAYRPVQRQAAGSSDFLPSTVNHSPLVFFSPSTLNHSPSTLNHSPVVFFSSLRPSAALDSGLDRVPVSRHNNPMQGETASLRNNPSPFLVSSEQLDKFKCSSC